MSADFLANLASRAMEQHTPAVGSVRPRIASLFEASPAASGRQGDRLAMAEPEPDRVAAGPGAERPLAPTVRRDAPPAAPAQPATASESLDLRLVAVVDAVRGPQHNSSILAPVPSPSGTFGAIVSPVAERTEGKPGDFSIRPQVVRIARGSGSPLVTPVLSVQGQGDSASTGEEWRPPAPSTRPSGAPLPAANLPPSPAANLPAASLPAPHLSATPLPAAYLPASASAAPEPVIQVTIGRIEVRAMQAASPPARKAGPSAQPATLDEYQKQRSQRGGGR